MQFPFLLLYAFYFFFSIVRLTESGIYQKWLLTNTYNLKDAKVRAPEVAFETAELEHFFGPVIVASIGFFLAAFMFIFESILNAFLPSRNRAHLYFRKRNLQKQIEELQKERRKRLQNVQNFGIALDIVSLN